MFKAGFIAISGMLVILLVSGSSFSQKRGINDEDAYYGTATIKGTVTILNHPTLGKTPGGSTYLVFQRTDCERCLVGTRTSVGGQYEIHVGPGRYKLIVRDGKRQGETKDALAPNQQRFIDAGQAGTITNFNVEIIVPKD